MGSAWRWANFTPAELRCSCGCDQVVVPAAFMDALQRLRDHLSLPIRLASACRCAAHNRSIRGHPRSLHVCDAPQHPGQTGTLAVDAAIPDGAYRGELVSLAWQLGWSIGWGGRRGFVHLDRRDMVGLAQTTFDY